MSKSYFILVILFSFIQSIKLEAQCCIAQDFITNDINGNTVHLYDMLNAGKIVILNISVATSPTCWDYHHSGALQNIWTDYGPEGSDEVAVILVEGHPDTGLADLQGNSPNSQGNWIAETSFPIINNDDIPFLFQTYSFPTVLMICPDKSYYYYTGLPSAQTIAANFYKCGNPEPGLHPTLLSYNGPSGEFCNHLNFTPTILLQNNGYTLLEQVEVALKFNETLLQIKNFEPNLSSFQSHELQFDPIQLGENGTLSYEIVTANQQDSDLGNNTFYDIPFSRALESESSTIQVEITTDDYGYETYWELQEDNGTVVASGGNPRVITDFFVHPKDPEAYEDQTVYTYTIPIESNQCYSFIIYDAAHDGICCGYGDGFYKIFDDNGNILFEGGEFYWSTSHKLDTSGELASTNDFNATASNSISLYPNPTTHSLNLSFDLTQKEDFIFEVYNNLGQLAESIGQQSFLAGQNTLSINTTRLPNGVYILKVKDGMEEFNEKFVVKK